jgi:hypothetical protein
MSGTAQIFPVVGASPLPNPLPTQDQADGMPGTPVPILALQVAGSDGTDLRAVATDAMGRVNVDVFGHAGTILDGVPGSAAPANALQVAGTDGTDLRALLTDATGKLIIIAQTSETINTVTGDSPTIINNTPVNGATQTNVSSKGLIATVILGTVSGSSPTLAVQPQWSPDGGSTWLAYGAATSALSVATSNTISIVIYPTALSLSLGGVGNVQTQGPLPRTWRLVYTGGGSAFSIAIASVQVNYVQ